jgi:hypothetical protein
MGAPTSEDVSTSAITRREGPQSLYGHVVALEKKTYSTIYNIKFNITSQSNLKKANICFAFLILYMLVSQ